MSDSGVLNDIGYLACCRDEGDQSDVQSLTGAAISWKDGTFDFVGPAGDLPEATATRAQYSAGGNAVFPGLVDCHTHLGFGGWRADEFRMRIEGRSYLEIAAEGGGIRKTMAQTRGASEEELRDHCEKYLALYVRQGVTAVECKSGYGLSLEEELKLLRVYRDIGQKTPIEVVSTLLAAHVVPDPDKCNENCYIQMICDDLLPEVARQGLAEFNDVFVEEGAFSKENARKILRAGSDLGLRPKLHVDQLQDGGGAELAAEVNAVSADHLEYTSADGIRAMESAGVTAVCLPFASLHLNQPPMKTRAFMSAGVRVAVATDFNPGSAPCNDLPLAMMLACTMSRMTPAEALKGATLYAARAIGRDQLYGSIENGKRANFIEVTVEDVDHWMYHFQANSCLATWIEGRQIFRASPQAR